MAGWIDAPQAHYVTVAPAHPVMDTYVDPLRLRIFDPSGIVAPDGMACLSDENSRVEIQARRGPFAMHQILRMSARVEISA